MPIFRERELVVHARREPGARPVRARPSSAATTTRAMAAGLRAIAAGARARRRAARRRTTSCADRRRARSPQPPGADHIAQLLFTSGTLGEPKGVLHRHDALDARRRSPHRALRARRRRRDLRPLAARPPDRLPVRDVDRAAARRAPGAPGGLGRRDRARRDAPVRRDVRAGGDAVPGRPGPGGRRARTSGPRGCGCSSPPAPRSRASWRATRARGARRRGRRRLGHDRELPGLRVRARRRARARLGHRRPRARRRHACGSSTTPAATLPAGEEGNFEVRHRLPVRGLPEPPRADRRGGHRRRLVPDRRPGAGSTPTATCGSPAGSRT